MTWRVAASLEVLLAEVNAAAPLRSKVSDGSIGDADHASRDSDHNPWVILEGVGIVRARDFTHDPNGGLDCNLFAARLGHMILAGRHPACRSGAYVIWNRRILSADRRDEGWRPYTGTNPHDHHCHLSVSLAPDGFDSTATWGVMNDEEGLDMDEAKLREIIASELDKAMKTAGDKIKVRMIEGQPRWSLEAALAKLRSLIVGDS